ncbi:MAG: beta-lactamase family protein [Lewinellaceae bacterium]|nr:beta-lactamase family protein [Lewinellaceae bacterium]
MKNLTAICFLPVYLAFVFTLQAQNEADALLKTLQSKGITGVAAGYSIDGATIWDNAVGFSCEDKGILFTDSTLTRTASLAKPMTAVAVLQLAEQGRLDLDAPIQQYLPQFPKKEKGDITTRQLLSHTSGISQYQSTKEIENTQNFETLEDAMKVFQDRPLLFEPGTNFFYTSYGYVVLGRIIEKISGQSFEAYMQINIWDKAGMRHTGIEKVGVTYPNKSCLYHRKKRRAKPAKQNDLSNRIPAGGFYSTVGDMLKFGNALLEGKLIGDSTFQLMTENQFAQKEGNPYGLGWFFYAPKPHENAVIGHSGEQTGAACQIMIVPGSKTVVVVLSNTSGTWKDVVTLCSALVAISEQG